MKPALDNDLFSQHTLLNVISFFCRRFGLVLIRRVAAKTVGGILKWSFASDVPAK